MNEIEKYTNRIFDDIKHIDENGCEYWSARELAKVLEYSEYRKFNKTINKAIESCKNSNQDIDDHFAQVAEMVEIGSGAKRKLEDYKFSRYACYLIVQNSDSKKKVVSLGQTYFAIQTRKMELSEQEYNKLTEDEKRLYRRRQTRDGNKIDRFTNAGYKGLYNGETANDIAKRKGLRYREDILDNMGSAELGANIFRITQTEALLEKQMEANENIATNTHYKVGKAVRETIEKLGGTMPENLPTPKKSIKELENEEITTIKEVD